jgi:hypothetical protein
MSRLAFVVAVMTAVPAAPALTQQHQMMPPPPQIVASARGEARVTPDRGTIYIGVQTRAKNAADASAENARKQRAVLDTLRALGVRSEHLSTVEYNVYPEQQYDPQRGDTAPRIIGYNVVNTVRVDVQRLEQLGRLIDAALAKGANGINQLQFQSSKADSVRRSALADAVAKARADAEAMASAAGGHLGELLEISQSGYDAPPYPVPMARMAAAEASQTPISPGEQTVNAVIVARWRFVTGAQ